MRRVLPAATRTYGGRMQSLIGGDGVVLRRVTGCSLRIVRLLTLFFLVLIGVPLLAEASAAASAPPFTEVPGSPFAVGGGGRSLEFSPSGGLLAVGADSTGVSVFSVGADGALQSVSGSPFGLQAYSVAFSPDGSLLAAANYYGGTSAGGDTVSMFSVGQSGALTPVSGSPFVVGSSGSKPFQVAFSPSGKLLAVGATGGMYMFSVSSSGALTPVSGSPFQISGTPVAFSPSGGLLVAVDVNAGVRVLSVSSSGALSELPGSPYKAFGATASGAAFSPDGSRLAVSNISGGVTMYSVSGVGALTPIGSAPYDASLESDAVAFSSNGALVSATGEWGGAAVLSVAASGALTVIGSLPIYKSELGSGAQAVAFSATGVVATADADGSVPVSAPTPSTATVASSTSVSAAPSPSSSGQSTTLTATVSGPAGSPTPTGTVTLVDDAEPQWFARSLGTATLDRTGHATLSTSSLTDLGSHAITARYSGDSTYVWSSADVAENVLAPSTTSLSSSVNPSQAGQGVTFTATVTGSSTPTGSVTFMDGSATLGTGTLASGTATLTTSSLAGGSHTITAAYGGDTTFGGSSASLTQVVQSNGPQGSWVGSYGSAGYDLAAWDGGSDVVSMPGATVSLVAGSRYEWAASTTDVRALQAADKSSRNAATYYDANEIKLQLGFSAAYNGNLELYAVDWDSGGRRETITVGNTTANLAGDFTQGAWVAFPVNVAAGATVTITVDRTAGTNAVLSGIFLGGAGTPPPWPPTPTTAPQGSWVGSYGSAGYDLGAWNGGSDVVSMPGATVSLVAGSRYEWAGSTTDVRALQAADKSSRNAATYYDANEIKLQLGFSAAYNGNLELYAVDWDSGGRRETITVGNTTANLAGDFTQGAWVAFPINVAAGATVTITVDRTAGTNAVLSGIFLGGAGTPPPWPPTPTTAPQGSWVGSYGSAGYDLAAWNGGSDVVSMPGATVSLVAGSRYEWAGSTTDVRALQAADKSSRNAATYYDANEIKLQLGFSAAYNGNLELYAVDWDSGGRRETITVGNTTANLAGDFTQGAWVAFPINVAAGATVTITVDRTAGTNAVLSGIFLN